ncbi:MAG: phosphoenolpyruvate--protein phosphotransferase [Oscillospiraceae bacterium]|nr:phosphoenolpyruvate--protein phosphotransferase [Oscillospiraceae bacterium]
MTTHQGKGICPGIAFGTVYLLQKADTAIQQTPGGTPDQEWTRFLAAKAKADGQLKQLFEKTAAELGEEQAMIIDVQRLMLEDGDFNDAVQQMIQTEQVSAPYAVSQAGKQFSDFFAALDDPYMRARATDVSDLSQRLTDILLGRRHSHAFTGPTVVVAEDLTPSETLQMDRAHIAAFVIRLGSSNSHTAILAQTMGIPCVIQTDIPLDPAIDGREIIVDGTGGLCYLEPDQIVREKMAQWRQEARLRQESLDGLRGLPTATKSGQTVRLFANIGGTQDIQSVLEHDAEGVGLFRSEFSYLGRSDYPTEAELFAVYRRVAEAMGGRQVIIRTLDMGADKKVDYFDLDQEENPALGLRGIRICIDRPEIFRTQLRAIYRASAFGNIAIMFPMITSLWEVIHCKEQAAAIRRELTAEGLPIRDVALGIMIETPAAVMVADALAKEVDFFSVGTNDLTQYTLAIDRQNHKLDRFYDPHHPAVLAMLQIVADSARDNGIWAGICGELAADPAVTATLLNMGFDELSVAPASVLEMRKRIRDMD